ncbi:MAG: mannose-1-phosphate guanylyltransferase/mannose-6-phosphate isomerase [Alphaproteobacteria bacterium]
MMADVIPVLLAGGVGVRLWPLSRESFPKQFLALRGEETLLQQAARRALAHAPAGNIVTVTTAVHLAQVRDQLGDLDTALLDHVIAEPAGRNTAAAVLLGALHAKAAFGPDAVMWSAPADHMIADEAALGRALEVAVRAARQGFLVTFGIAPGGPDPTLGYIRRGAALSTAVGAFAIDRFVEKPAVAEAERLIAEGETFWNSGMFVFTVATVLDEAAGTAPEVIAAVGRAFAAAPRSAPFAPPAELYARVPALPFDRAIMERSTLGAVVPCELGWSDVGDWDRFGRVSDRDAAGNVLAGDVVVHNSRDNVVRTNGRLVALAGVANMVVVETRDAVLVADRHDSAGVKALVEQLKALGRLEASYHPNERRPWGSFTVLLEGARFKIKEIVVKPGARLSLQMHHHRSEHWVVIEGAARVTRGDEVVMLAENQSTFIPQGTRHRLENPGTAPLRIVEVQSGGYIGEDDIVRFEDAYGRVP